MKYTITLVRYIDSNTGDNLLVYIGQDEKEFKKKLKELEKFFIKTGRHLETKVYEVPTLVKAYIEYGFQF